MQIERSAPAYWDRGDVLSLVLAALKQAGIPADDLTLEDLAPVDHFHARGLAATLELADRLPVKPRDHILDIGCGLGGPARYFAVRFKCQVTGIDIAPSFVKAAKEFNARLGLDTQVIVDEGDGQDLPYGAGRFDGAYALHVTMNVPDRSMFFGEIFRVLKPGAFFALSEHGLGAVGNPYHPVPWSEDGREEHLLPPSETRGLLETAGFEEIRLDDTREEYLAAYKHVIELAAQGGLPPLGPHILLGERAPEMLRNAARNIEEGRTHPVRVICRKSV